MKTSKLLTLDIEIAMKLTHIDNASALVNKLLTEYFAYNEGKKKSDDTTSEQT